MQSELVQSQKSLFSHYPNKLTKQSSFWKLTVMKSRIFQHFMDRAHKSLPLAHLLSQIQPITSHPTSLTAILILASHPHHVYHVVSFPMISPSKPCRICLLSHVWHVPQLSHSSWSNNPNNICSGTQIIKCLQYLLHPSVMPNYLHLDIPIK